MSNEVSKLSDSDIRSRLKTLPMWIVSDGELQRTFLLPSFPSAIFFVNAVAHLAELGAHHPDIYITYNKVRLNFVTHSVGSITAKDFVMAQKVDELWRTFDEKANI